MSDLFAFVLIGLGLALIAMGLSGNYATLPAALGISLPGVEQAGPVTTRKGA